MRKIMVVLMVFVCFTASADWLSVDMAFQMGWIPNGNLYYYIPNPKAIELNNSFDATFQIDALIFNFIKTGGKCIILFSDTADFMNFCATGMTYFVYAGIEPIKGISIIYEHSCSHPVATYFGDFYGTMHLDSGYSRIYFEIKTSVSY